MKRPGVFNLKYKFFSSASTSIQPDVRLSGEVHSSASSWRHQVDDNNSKNINSSCNANNHNNSSSINANNHNNGKAINR